MVEYLIIGGATKCATTSLYSYLGQHPNICPSSYKETRFFLNPDYPLKRHAPVSNTLSDYLSFFKDCANNTIKMEATPDYLYSANTEHSIKKLLNNSLIIFIVRNPIDRLLSWFKFAKQMTLLGDDISFDKYIDQMKNDSSKKAQHLLALEQGKYCSYINNYIKCFGKENVAVISYDDLTNEPYNTMLSICQKINIPSDFYQSYSFKVHNKTVEVKNKFLHQLFIPLRRLGRKSINKLPPVLKSAFKKRASVLVSGYFNLNSENNKSFHIKDETKQFLKEYYFDSNSELEHIINKKLDWNN